MNVSSSGSVGGPDSDEQAVFVFFPFVTASGLSSFCEVPSVVLNVVTKCERINKTAASSGF